MPTIVKTRKDPFRTLLLKKRNELLAEVKRGPEALATNIQSPDAVEFAVKAAVRKFLRHVLRQFHGLGIVSIARKSSQETSLITRCRVCPGAYPVISS